MIAWLTQSIELPVWALLIMYSYRGAKSLQKLRDFATNKTTNKKNE